ncbi:lantibiotic dehydratase [Streptomyces sp. NPDC088354]|uniref:lantibiotic dehydratase n=1 Tax=Streptomyces sp. NPDC088354 TaxID=3365856 RepID=UPI00382F4118
MASRKAQGDARFRDLVEQRETIRFAAIDSRIREALEVSSPSLASAVDRIAAGEAVSDARLRKISDAVSRYLIRMSTRPTPFGLMAGVTAANLGEATIVEFGQKDRKAVRPDMSWLIPLLARWERQPNIWKRMQVTVNDLHYARGDRLVMPYVPDTEGILERSLQGREKTVRNTAPVRFAIQSARNPVSGLRLRDQLMEKFPHAQREVVESLVTQLIEVGILLVDLRPSPFSPDPLGDVIGRLRTVPDFSDLEAMLSIQQGLRAYSSQPIGQGETAWKSVTEQMRSLYDTDALVQVDLALDTKIVLAKSVSKEAERAARALWKLSLEEHVTPLQEYHTKFIERYGLRRSIGLRELLDPNIGLGAPKEYRSSREPRPPVSSPQRDAVLAELLMRCVADMADEIVLDDDIIDKVASVSKLPPAASMEICGSLIAPSIDAVDAGEFRLWLSPASGSRLAGAMFGRFGHLLSSDMEVPFTTAGSDTQGPLQAQLCFHGSSARGHNLTQSPQWLDHRIMIGSFEDRTDPAVIPLDDLAVTATPERLVLISISHRREIVPVVFNMLNARSNVPPIARFLRDMYLTGRRSWEPWNWGALAAMPYLPRVRYGRAILSPARWRGTASFFTDDKLTDHEWHAMLEKWRMIWHVPDTVAITKNDQRLHLNLTNAQHARMFRQQIRKNETIEICEIPGHGSDSSWLMGSDGPRHNEIVFPLSLTPVSNSARSSNVGRQALLPRPASCDGPYPLGSEWVYGKLYGSSEQQNEILTDHLPQFLKELGPAIDRWFFVRYRDPAPHLRLRFNVRSPSEANEIIPRLGTWAAKLRAQALASHLVLDVYDPEIERYGGRDALVLAERVFQKDSESVIEQLRLRTTLTDIDSVLLAALNFTDIMHHLETGGQQVANNSAWLLNKSLTEEDRGVFRKYRRDAMRLADPENDWIALRGISGGEEIMKSWPGRAAALVQYRDKLESAGTQGLESPPISVVKSALLHMHHNRLIGIDSVVENYSVAVASGVAQAARNRKRFSE